MLKNNYINYKKYLKTKKINNEIIFIAKTNKSFLIGPLLDENFNEYSFYKRIISNSIYSPNIYKMVFGKKAKNLIQKYSSLLNSNEVIELFNNGNFIKHKIIKVPGGFSEK